MGAGTSKTSEPKIKSVCSGDGKGPEYEMYKGLERTYILNGRTDAYGGVWKHMAGREGHKDEVSGIWVDGQCERARSQEPHWSSDFRAPPPLTRKPYETDDWSDEENNRTPVSPTAKQDDPKAKDALGTMNLDEQKPIVWDDAMKVHEPPTWPAVPADGGGSRKKKRTNKKKKKSLYKSKKNKSMTKKRKSNKRLKKSRNRNRNRK